VFPKIQSEHPDHAGGGGGQAEDQVHRGGFARAIDAEQPERFAGGHAEGQPVQGGEVAEGFGQPIGFENGSDHAPSLPPGLGIFQRQSLCPDDAAEEIQPQMNRMDADEDELEGNRKPSLSLSA